MSRAFAPGEKGRWSRVGWPGLELGKARCHANPGRSETAKRLTRGRRTCSRSQPVIEVSASEIVEHPEICEGVNKLDMALAVLGVQRAECCRTLV